jgi:poly-gamma-glutamate synthesis protein (capsule biosynthesis protein)
VLVRALTVAAVLGATAQAAQAQAPSPPPPGVPPAAPAPAPRLQIRTPKLVASAIRVPVQVRNATPKAWVAIEVDGDRVGRTRADARGVAETAIPAGLRERRVRVQAVGYGRSPSPTHTVRMRDISLDAFGDANFGDGVGDVMASLGPRYPWSGVAATLKAADIAFGNLECAISAQGVPVPKEYNFRGSPSALRSVVPYAGIDVFNLANNHVGDFGTAALLDTVRNVQAAGAQPVGAGTPAQSARPAIVTRLGLRVAFVGFSDVVPAGFAVGAGHPGTAIADPDVIRATIAQARRQADVVVATFHWGIERDPGESARQRELAQIAAAAGASAIIGAHPHVLQPIRRIGTHGLVAYSLGNFVWSAGSAASAATGILEVDLSARGVEAYRLRRATIVNTRPQLD